MGNLHESETALLLRENEGLVVYVAGQYRHRGVAMEDLVAAGKIGILEARRRYDADRDARFSTYAVWWIRKSVIQALREHGRQVPVPRYQLRKSKARVGGDGAIPWAEIVMRLGEVSLDAPVAPGGVTTFRDRLADDGATSPLDVLLRDEELRVLRAALEGLRPRERRVLAYRFGLEKIDEGMSLLSAGERLGLSRERVRQIESQALERLRRSVGLRPGCPRSYRVSRGTGSRSGPSRTTRPTAG